VATPEVKFLHPLHPFAEVLVFPVVLQGGVVRLEDHPLSSFSLRIMMNYYSSNYSIT
jgi:hypothetical protein